MQRASRVFAAACCRGVEAHTRRRWQAGAQRGRQQAVQGNAVGHGIDQREQSKGRPKKAKRSQGILHSRFDRHAGRARVFAIEQQARGFIVARAVEDAAVDAQRRGRDHGHQLLEPALAMLGQHGAGYAQWRILGAFLRCFFAIGFSAVAH